jgi:3-isopropylmalate/(R)-2-methylmalate dehydratase small subunit
MQPFIRITGVVAPLDRANVDTDAIIPKQYLKSIQRSGFGANLFDDWRYLDPGEPDQDQSARRLNPDFVLNKPAYRAAQILLTRKNFGCGSSREHAVWALMDAGFRTVIAPSFADIFFNNSLKNGLLSVVLADAVVDRLFVAVVNADRYELTVDLETQTVTAPDGEHLSFNIDASQRYRLLKGLDDIDLTLTYADDIRRYEARRRVEAPWLF